MFYIISDIAKEKSYYLYYTVHFAFPQSLLIFNLIFIHVDSLLLHVALLS